MADLFSGLTGVVDKYMQEETVFSPYYFFEPFDCPEPSPETIAKAVEDGVDLFNDDVAKLAGPYPRPFQSGVLLSKASMVAQVACSRAGKSITSQVLIGAAMSRQPPYSLRYEKGVDTGIRRQIVPINIMRFGRRDSTNGKLIDHNIHAQFDPQSWNCGNIEGVGIFPEELYVPDGGQIWIGTVAAAIKTLWWPLLAGTGRQRFLPVEFLDQSKGNHGSNHGEMAVYGMRDVTVFIKSYDSPRQTEFESQECHLLVWDEEPKNPKHYISGTGHSKFERFSFTPLNGLSFTNSLFFGHMDEAAKSRAKIHGVGVLDRGGFEFYQASKYDSPYIDSVALEETRKTQPPYARKQITWGRYAEHTGNPFYDRSKIEHWRKIFLHPHRKITLSPATAFQGMYGDELRHLPGLLDIKIIATKVAEDDLRTVFRIYENPIPGVGYLWVADPAEGATDPKESQDFGFGMMIRAPRDNDKFDNIARYDYPVIVATIRSTLQTEAFAKYTSLAFRWYNNAVIAPERGHGSANEAYGQNVDEWPFWYYSAVANNKTHNIRGKKGFDTNTGTRDPMLLKVRTWLDDFEQGEDPGIKDSWLYDELAGAVTKESKNGKKRCDHPRNGYLDGVICLAIATYIHDETPGVIVCNYVEPEKQHELTFLQRMMEKNNPQYNMPAYMGEGVGKIGGNGLQRLSR